MTADPDEEALAWAGDEPVKPAKPSVAEPVEARVEVVSPDARPAIPAVLLVTYGILAGIYLIYTIGWVISIQRLNQVSVASTEALNQIMFLITEVLAVASPAIWFIAAVILTWGRKPIVRLLAILVGLVTVLPWPFVLGAWLA